MTRRVAPLLHTDLERRRINPAPAAPPTIQYGPSRVDQTVLTATGVAWFLLLFVAVAVVPEADGANAEQLSAVSAIAGFFQFAAIVAVMLLVMSGSRRAAGAAMLAGGGLFLASATACVATGHHAFGPWWYGQAAALGGMMLAGAVALRGSGHAKR